jgi:RNA polymerase sigma-70 factor (ECF subfamily)
MGGADARDALETAYRTDGRRVLATLIRLLGGFEPAEEALHEAFAAAALQWPKEGVPENPYGWLVSVGRFKTIDRWRRQARLNGALPDLAFLSPAPTEPAMPHAIQDDELRLIFLCCHPDLPADARVALTLREVGGLTTEEIARAFLTTAPTIAQRIVRAKARIRDEAIAYDLPGQGDLQARLLSALQVIYLIFNEGYAATSGPELTRGDLCAEAVRLGRLVAQLTDAPEARGLLALMLLHEARRATRVDGAGDLILLEDQDRSRWDRQRIAEAQALIAAAGGAGSAGPYHLQAAIAASHAAAPSFARTDWARIVALYDQLMSVAGTPVTALNRAAALAMRDGPAAGLAAIDAVMMTGALDGYGLAHAARADMLRRLDRSAEAAQAYDAALTHTRQPSERRFLGARLAALRPSPDPAE